MHLLMNDQIHLTEFRPTDKAACVQHLQEREIYERTTRTPWPYTEADFDNWLEITVKATEQHGEPIHFAIRTSDDSFIGGCGFDELTNGHQAEIGYWLALPEGRAVDRRQPVPLEPECLGSRHVPAVRGNEGDFVPVDAEVLLGQFIDDRTRFVDPHFVHAQDVLKPTGVVWLAKARSRRSRDRGTRLRTVPGPSGHRKAFHRRQGRVFWQSCCHSLNSEGLAPMPVVVGSRVQDFCGLRL